MPRIAKIHHIEKCYGIEPSRVRNWLKTSKNLLNSRYPGTKIIIEVCRDSCSNPTTDITYSGQEYYSRYEEDKMVIQSTLDACWNYV